MRPLISIVIPVYNGAKFLATSLQSCIDQTYKNLEIIVVNDCSTDESLAIATTFATKDDRIKIINNNINKKLPASLNIGHKAATGKFISWTSDDNLYEPIALETLYNTLKKSKKDIAYSSYHMIEEDGSHRRNVSHSNNSHVLLGNTIGASFLYRKEVFNRNNGYNEALHTVEDYDFWIRAYLHSSYVYVPKYLYRYRIHSESLTSKLSEKASKSQQRFEENLLTSYGNFFKVLFQSEHKDLANKFYKLSRTKEIEMVTFLKDYENFIEDLNILKSTTPNTDFAKLIIQIDLCMRKNLRGFKSNKNIKTLTAVIKYRPKLLYGYDRRRSIKYIVSCLS